jgi:hypothetical protein
MAAIIFHFIKEIVLWGINITKKVMGNKTPYVFILQGKKD